MRNKSLTAFTSRLSRGESVAVLAYLPIHVLLLPWVLRSFIRQGALDTVNANFICYGVGFVYMLGLLRRFLRRDFDPLCDRPGHCLVEILAGYGLMYLGNLLVNLLFMLVSQAENPNNAGVIELADGSWQKTLCITVFLAPMVEECLFRAGIFGTLRHRSRILAYGVTVLAFSVYHIWAYALTDPGYWLYLLQYVPVSLVLCRVYERTNSIWCSIFFHMLANYIALNALKFLEALL